MDMEIDSKRDCSSIPRAIQANKFFDTKSGDLTGHNEVNGTGGKSRGTAATKSKNAIRKGMKAENKERKARKKAIRNVEALLKRFSLIDEPEQNKPQGQQQTATPPKAKNPKARRPKNPKQKPEQKSARVAETPLTPEQNQKKQAEKRERNAATKARIAERRANLKARRAKITHKTRTRGCRATYTGTDMELDGEQEGHAEPTFPSHLNVAEDFNTNDFGFSQLTTKGGRPANKMSEQSLPAVM